MSWMGSKVTCTVVTLILLPKLCFPFFTPMSSPEKSAPAAKTVAASTEDLKNIAAQLENMFQALEAAARDIPRDTFDPRAIVQEVGYDPEKLFLWVRDNTYWVP